MSFTDMIEVAENTKKMAALTLTELEEQKNTIQAINNKMGLIDKIIDKSNNILNRIGSIMNNIISKVKLNTESTKDNKTPPSIPIQKKIITSKPFDNIEQMDDDQDLLINLQKSQLLDTLIENIQIIKHMNIIMGQELEDQEGLLDILTENMDKHSLSLINTTDKINHLLH